MTTTEDKKEIPESTENPENQENQEEEQEEEPVDLELQKEMKGLKIEASDFAGEPKAKKQNKKSKNTEDKKGKKKGQDFLDYANKNNIQINIEYEENKYQLKKKEDQKYGEKGGNKSNENKKQFNRGGYKNEKNRTQKRQQNYYTGNKFDNYGWKYYQNNYQHQVPKLIENKEILEYLEKMFGEENLNKNLYLSKRINQGKILIDDIVNYNDIKKNNINADKILETIKDSQNLECINEDNKNYIKIKNFEKLKLISPDQIYQNKKAGRPNRPYNQMPYQQYQYPSYGNNYINMQNNFYFPPSVYNYSQLYANNNYIQPTPENK